MRKKLLYVTTVIILFVVLIADFYLGRESTKQEIKIDIIVKEVGTDFWNSVEIGARSYKGEIPINIKVTGPRHEKDYITQMRYLEDSIESEPDAILIAPGNNYDLTKYIDQANAKKIPIILIDSYVRMEEDISYVGSDNNRIGVMLAEEIIKLAPSSPKVGIISFVKEAPAAIERKQAFLDTLITSNIEVSSIVYTNSNMRKAEDVTIEMLADNPDINILVGLNSQSTIGAAKAIQKLKKKEIILGGVDLTVEQVGHLEDNILDFSIVQNPFLMGYNSVEQVYLHIKHRNKITNRIIESIVIDEENLYLKENQQLIFPFNSY